MIILEYNSNLLNVYLDIDNYHHLSLKRFTALHDSSLRFGDTTGPVHSKAFFDLHQVVKLPCDRQPKNVLIN